MSFCVFVNSENSQIPHAKDPQSLESYEVNKFIVEEDETILAAALRQGLSWPFSCKNGVCGTCKSYVLQGKVRQAQHTANVLSAKEVDQGLALFCCAYPLSDLTVAAPKNIIRKKIIARIISMEKIHTDVMILKLQLPASLAIKAPDLFSISSAEKVSTSVSASGSAVTTTATSIVFLPGQYIDIILPKGKRRSYSVANLPHINGIIELHLRHMPGGIFTSAAFSENTENTNIKQKDIIRLEGPFGNFLLQEQSIKPMIMLASGTGFAPIKAMLEALELNSTMRQIVFYWGVRRPQDLYMHQECLRFAATIKNLIYIPVVSEALPEDNWIGRQGLVHKAVMADTENNLSPYEVYACGAPAMIESARRDFTNHCHLAAEQFYADAFVPATDKDSR